MARIDTAKVLFYTLFIVGALGLSFAVGLHSGAKKTAVYRTVKALKQAVEDSVSTVFVEATTLAKIRPENSLQLTRHQGAGVTLNDAADQGDLILLSGFFENDNELRLIRRDGTIVARWPVRFSQIFPDTAHILDRSPPATDWNTDTDGALVLPDGSVVFNFEYFGLAKLDRCGAIAWTLARQTHHSVERAEGGGYWVPGRRYFTEEMESPFPPFDTPFSEDTILKVSEDGKVLAEISVPQLFYDNGLEAVLTATGSNFLPGMGWDSELVHLNKVEELTGDLADDFPLFEKGDLALSIRELNHVMVVDPDDLTIKWQQVGPWLRQHDPEFRAGGTIGVFNNNLYRKDLTQYHRSDPSMPRVSNIIEIDPVSGKHEIIYGQTEGQEFLSVIRGKFEFTPNGGLLITEFEGGRVFETDPAGNVIWQYVNQYDADYVAEISEARLYSASYFDVPDWSCEGRVN